MSSDAGKVARAAVEQNQGIFRLAPNWVPRTFLHPGRRLKLAEQDLYALGTQRGGIDERWLSSCIPADNPGASPDEGHSFVVHDGKRVRLADAVAALGAEVVGKPIWERYAKWPIFGKFFDNMGMIPHHMHQSEEHARNVGREPKPEAYYFPPQLNKTFNNFPYTFLGLAPGTTREDVRRCLERWHQGDNGILDLTSAYRLKPGTGWLIGTGILHAPGSLVTFEPQWASDVLALFQSIIEDRVVSWDLLVKDVPADKHQDLDYIVGMLDWEANVDPDFKRNHYLEPIPVADTASAGYVDRWVVYGRIKGEQKFSAKELTVEPGRSVTIKDAGACGLVVTQGRGKINGLYAEAPISIRYGEMTADEFFITAPRAAEGVTFEASAEGEPFVTLRYFGPDAQPDAPEVGAHRQ
ncbi:MAG: hypothetical protein JXO22_13545 [Phycisphaerae bacterium]|nr:hypothetical protein [Phycisphaerae bacterium]